MNVAVSGLVLLPGSRTLDEIADSIRSHWEATEEDRFAIGRDLMDARQQFSGDREFGAWLVFQGFPFTSEWGRVLRLAAENEPEVRALLASQLASGRKPNIEKAVKAVLHPEPPTAKPKEEPTEETDSHWSALVSVMESIEALSIDASAMAATVPSRRRATTAKRLRKLGTYLGRVAWSLEGMVTSQ